MSATGCLHKYIREKRRRSRCHAAANALSLSLSLSLSLENERSSDARWWCWGFWWPNAHGFLGHALILTGDGELRAESQLTWCRSRRKEKERALTKKGESKQETVKLKIKHARAHCYKRKGRLRKKTNWKCEMQDVHYKDEMSSMRVGFRCQWREPLITQEVCSLKGR